MANEYKPGWEQTMMAEDIFKEAVAKFMASHASSVGVGTTSTWEQFANVAMDAAIVFRKRQTERKFPDLVTLGTTDETK